MDSKRWQKIQDIFEEVVALPEQERAPYLEKTCAGDTELEQEIKAMLMADASDNSLLDQPINENSMPAVTDLSGEFIGPYRIVHEIASGGMGTVYLAERSDGQFDQQVALKLIKPGLHSGDIISRFQHERQILAQLQHPNIAQLLDGGLSATGLPYFSMEYVSGMPITEYCDQHQLNMEQRIRIFMTVCQAVQYAHNNLIIHRDLKPGNIFITDDGTVKLLDFGIAKVFNEQQNNPGLTVTGTFAFTPEYAAPEQIQTRRISTATDVYALGLILYELMVGIRPFEFSSSSLLEIEKIITTNDPQRPSTQVKKHLSKAGETKLDLAKISRARKTSPEKLVRTINGDLDTICLMALKREPERRYASVDLLRQDLELYLSGLPVRARKDSMGYRMQKFVGRHRLGVTATAVVLMVIASIISFYTWQLSSQRDRAVSEAQKAQAVTNFLVDLFEVADPNQAQGNTITVREVLDRGADRIANELSDQPETQISMYDVISKVYYSLGLWDESLFLVEKSLQLRKNMYGESHPEIAKTLSGMGYVHCAMGNYELADSLLFNAIQMNKLYLNPDHPEFAKAYGAWAWVWNLRGDYNRADTLYRKTIEIQRKNNNPEVGITLNNLALLMHEMNRYEESEAYFRQSMELHRQNYGEVHPELATTLYNYAQLQRDMDNIETAIDLHQQVLEMDKKLHGVEHPDIAYSMNGLASLLVNTGKLIEAEELYRQALDMRRRLLGADHPDVAYNLNNLGRLFIKQEKYSEANSLFFEALEIQKKVYGREHQAISRTYKNIGIAYYHLQDYPRSEKYLIAAMEMAQKILSDKHFSTANTKLFLSKTLAAINKYDLAIDYANQALETSVILLGDSHSFTLFNMRNLAGIYQASGNSISADSLQLKIDHIENLQ